MGITDPRVDHQPVTEGSYANVPIVAFANVDSPTKFIDIAIPCNNKSPQSIGLMWWMLAREVLRLRGSISRDLPWEIMPDLFFYRDPEEIEKEERERAEAAPRARMLPKVRTLSPLPRRNGELMKLLQTGQLMARQLPPLQQLLLLLPLLEVLQLLLSK